MAHLLDEDRAMKLLPGRVVEGCSRLHTFLAGFFLRGTAIII